eukprot:9060263-Pyramimonas_sp.AAC.1
MGIGYANQGEYAESIKYYVRALTMNVRAANIWGYLRISCSCIGRCAHEWRRVMRICDEVHEQKTK